MKKILVTQYLPKEVTYKFGKEFELEYPDIDKGKYTYDEVKQIIGKYNGLLTIGCKADKDMLDLGILLEAVANLGVGYDNIDYRYAGEKGIYVVNTPSSVTHPTAELTIGLMLSISRGIVRLDKQLRTVKKTGLPAFSTMTSSVYSKTLGVIGFGRIGREVARRAKALGMNIIYNDLIQAKKLLEEELNARFVSLEELLKISDYVTLHCPYVPENYHLIDDKAFNLMKKEAYLINASRGPVVDEKALANALKENIIKGAALDVYENEPQITEALFGLENIVMVPHIGTFAYDVRINMADEALTGICTCLKGEVACNVVNKEYYVDR